MTKYVSGYTTVGQLIKKLKSLNNPQAAVVTLADGGAGYDNIDDPKVISVKPSYYSTGQYEKSEDETKGLLAVLISW